MPEIAFVAPPHEDKAVSPWDFDVANQPDWLRIGPTKIFADGAITTRTAALRRPYVDSEGAGLPTYDPDSLASMVRRAHANGWQVATHAMGDRAIDMVLDAYEQAQQAVPRPDPRHRIEHCSLPDPDLCRRIESLGVVPVMQPELLGRFGDSYIEGLGPERAAHAMPVGWLRRLGVPVAFSSDRPVVSGSPKFGIWSALSRTTPSGRVLGPAHRVDAEQALCSYTANAAYAGFLEHSRGRLAPGFLADFAVLDRDIVTCARDEILDARVVMTVVGGEVVYEA